MIRLTRLLAAGSAAALASGCAVPYMLDTYGARATNVELSCRQSYQVFDNTVVFRLLIKPYPASEPAYLACAALSKEEVAASLSARIRQAAEKHFVATGRPTCLVTGEQRLGLAEFEISYACPTAPPAKAKRP